MGPVSAVRPVVQTSGTSGQPPAGQTAGTGTAAQNGARNTAASAAETERPVTASSGAARSSAHFGDQNYLVEIARERAQSAHRAYTMTMLALGQNPLRDPIP